MIVVINFSPVLRENYYLTVDEPGLYEEVLSSDEIRVQISKEQGWEPYDQEKLGEINGMVFEYIRKTASTLLKEGKNVVLDATNLGRKKRKNISLFQFYSPPISGPKIL